MADRLPPLPFPLVVDESHAWMPDAFVDGILSLEPVTFGLGIAWAPMRPEGPAILLLQGGNPNAPSPRRLVVQMTREGIEGLGRDLLSIAEQLEPLKDLSR